MPHVVHAFENHAPLNRTLVANVVRGAHWCHFLMSFFTHTVNTRRCHQLSAGGVRSFDSFSPRNTTTNLHTAWYRRRAVEPDMDSTACGPFPTPQLSSLSCCCSADHRQAIERMAAVRRGKIREEPQEEEPPPPWTPFPANATLNRLRKAVVAELGLFSMFVYVVIFLNAMVLCLDSATDSERTERVLSGVRRKAVKPGTFVFYFQRVY